MPEKKEKIKKTIKSTAKAKPKKVVKKTTKKKVVKKTIKPKKVVKNSEHQVPEDKYTEALIKQEELSQIREFKKQLVAPQKIKSDYNLKPEEKNMLHVWIYVVILFSLIFIGWLFTFRIRIDKADMNLSDYFSSFTNDFSDDLNMLQENVTILEKITDSDNEDVNINENVNFIINNPNNLTEQDIKEMEEKVFPDLKN